VVCQIDVLRRIKPDSDIVKKTLANLPRTLDETYGPPDCPLCFEMDDSSS
jgi:hypothetical protein